MQTLLGGSGHSDFSKNRTTDRFCGRQLGCESVPGLLWAEWGVSRVMPSALLSSVSPSPHPFSAPQWTVLRKDTREASP